MTLAEARSPSVVSKPTDRPRPQQETLQSEASRPLFDDPLERERRIRLAAYLRFLQRNCEPGHELDDWLAAEAEIDGCASFMDWDVVK
jgi:hypothetical protein